MAVLVDENTRVLVQGIAGVEGRFHTERMIEYGTKVAAGVDPAVKEKDFRGFGGTLYHRTAFAGATTGQQLVYALDEQVRRYEAEGLVEKFEYWSMQNLLKDSEGRCRGIVALNMPTMEVRAFRAPAVIMAVGGPGLIFGRTTNSMINTGSAVVRAFKAGARLGNPEFVQVHPTAIAGVDKRRLISESVRGEGGRVWTYKDGKKWYFFEEMYPAYDAVAKLQEEKAAQRSIHFAISAEKLHAGLYGNARELVLNGQDFDDDSIHVCSVCGYTGLGDAPERCPVRSALRDQFKLF